MSLRLDGRAAVVTGAGSGIGLEIAALLIERGARVLLNDADFALAQEAASRIGATPQGSPVGDADGARRIVDAALSAFGRLDILVNNAGVVAPGPFDGGDDRDLERVMRVNLMGPYALCRAAWPHLCANGNGRIVNVSSSAALGSGISGPYAVSKAGVIGLTREAAAAGAPFGLRANALMPSAWTAMLRNHPDPAFRDWMMTHFEPHRVAPVAVFLASDDCALNGEILTTGGGRVSRVAFMESEGVFDPALSPETVAQQVDRIMSLEGARPLASQADHQAAYARVFPDYPLG